MYVNLHSATGTGPPGGPQNQRCWRSSGVGLLIRKHQCFFGFLKSFCGLAFACPRPLPLGGGRDVGVALGLGLGAAFGPALPAAPAWGPGLGLAVALGPALPAAPARGPAPALPALENFGAMLQMTGCLSRIRLKRACAT